jgi:hypothetical protein
MVIFNSFLYVYQARYIWHVRYPKLRLQRQLILRPSMGVREFKEFRSEGAHNCRLYNLLCDDM